jgi:hypothetical protein
MLVGYMRVSKSEGSQNTDLQRDALLAAGIERTPCMRTRPPARKTTAQISQHA